MKGVLICGGTGSRLRPLTEITNKSLLPVYDKPLLLYPLQTLLDAEITEIMIVSGTEHIDQMASFLGSGKRFNCHFSYRVQDEPNGIAKALEMAEEFVQGDDVCALLGDNIYFDNLSTSIKSFSGGAHIFVKQVEDPRRFGVVELDSSQNPVSIEEKPKQPKSNLAQTGCYLYDSRCFEIIKQLEPSWRNEYEITDVTQWYLDRGKLGVTILEDEWIDAGTFESLFKATSLIRKRKLNVAQQTAKQTAESALEDTRAETKIMERVETI